MEELVKKMMLDSKIAIETKEKGIQVNIKGNKISIMYLIVELLRELLNKNFLDEDDIEFMMNEIKQKTQKDKTEDLSEELVNFIKSLLI